MSARVLKFGGTSLGTPTALAGALARAGEAAREAAVVIVVSAFAGVTDEIAVALARASERDGRYRSFLAGLRERTARLLFAVAGGREAQRAEARCAERIQRLREILDAVALLRGCPAELHDEALASGERISAAVFAAGLHGLGLDCESTDASEVVRTDSAFGCGNADPAATAVAARERLGGARLAVVPGFFGADARGRAVLLGRGGSDTSATLLGAALRADRIEIYTDVDGILTADPRLVSDASTLRNLSYEDAALAAVLGAKVLHARAIAPAARARIPVVVRNSFRDGFESLIDARPTPSGFVVTATRDLALAWRAAIGESGHRHAGVHAAVALDTGEIAVAALGPEARGRGRELLAALEDAHVEVRALAAGTDGPAFLAVIDGGATGRAVVALHSALLATTHAPSLDPRRPSRGPGSSQLMRV